MMSIAKTFFEIQLVLLLFNYTKGSCPRIQQYYDSIWPHVQHDDNYLRSSSYYNYETDCSRFVEQPPELSHTVIEHAFNSSIAQTQLYVELDNHAGLLAIPSNFPSPKYCTNMDRNNYYFEYATKYVQETMCLSKNTTVLYLGQLQLDEFQSYLTENLTKIPYCKRDGQMFYPNCSDQYSFSNVDGTCNNLKKPLDGSTGDCMLRLLPPDYKDGFSEMRSAMDGSPLVSARIVSTNLLGNDEDRPLSRKYTQFHAFFGELVISDNGMILNHDNGIRNNIQFCEHENHTRVNHPQYKPISILPDDVLVRTFPNQKCMPFVRSIPCARCNLGPRKIPNSVTAAQDLNTVYGVSRSMLASRRTMSGGLLKSQIVNGEELYAVERFNATGRFRCLEGKCEISALDQRNVQLPTGQALAMLFHRNHNRHARRIAKIKPDWSDEQIFRMARKWNIGEYQHSLYNDYVKTLIGVKLAKSFGILPKPIGTFSKYNQNVPMKAILEFQSAAGRHGHAALEEDMTMLDPKSKSKTVLNFRQSELWETIFYDGHFAGLFLGQMSNPAYETTPSVPFKSFLYEVPGRTFGLDLAATDTQRHRDHGIPGYIYYVKYCHNVKINDWKDLMKFIDLQRIEKLKKFYKFVDDVDLLVGGHYERRTSDTLVGPTFACIIGMQFHNVKYGDRYFYEHGNQIGSFGIDQLDEIKTKSSMASLLCKNTNLDEVLKNPFRLESTVNKFVPCTSFEDIDYKL